MIFSVIVPVYKVEEYLEACVESVLNQTFSDFELILVDDGSPDRCPMMCDEYAKKDNLIKVVHKPNGGLASARQAGIKAAKGDYVFNLDSDDKIENDTLESAYKIISETNCDIVSFSYKWVKDGNVISVTTDGLDEGFYDEDAMKQHIYSRVLMDSNMNHISYYLAGKAVKRELVTPNQLSVNTDISLGEDLCCVVPCYLDAKSVYISKKQAYLYSVRTTSLSKEFNCDQIFKLEKIINYINDIKQTKPDDFSEQLCRYSAFMTFAIFAQAAEEGRFESLDTVKNNIVNSVNMSKIQNAQFDKITIKSRIGISLMKNKHFKTAFYFLNVCKKIKKILNKG